MEISLYKMFSTDTLRHRQTAKRIVEKILKEPESDQTIIDFDKIEFASWSFLHELINDLSSKNVIFINKNKEVENMISIISKIVGPHTKSTIGSHYIPTSLAYQR